MQLRSTSAKHKLAITAFLLILFAMPFAMQWASVKAADTKAVLAGGAVVGNQNLDIDTSAPKATNNAGQATNLTGKSFLGVTAQ